MPNRNNPFKPNKPIHPGMFCGRFDEINKIKRSLYSTVDDNPNHLLFLGERGIGKTSLLLLSKYYSTGDIKIDDDNPIQFLTLYLSLDKNMNKIDLCKKIVRQIERDFRNNSSKLQLLKDIWKFVQRIEVSGTKINSTPSTDESEMIDDLIYSISDTIKQITNDDENKKDGIVFLFDEVDNMNKSLELGLLIKKITEQLSFDETNKALFILCGLPISRVKLLESHPSSIRLFEEITLKPLKKDDCIAVINAGLREANLKNDIPVTIEDKAIDSITFFAEGYPHFLQQFCYCAYETDTDSIITDEDISKSSLEALSLVGDRYYKDLFYKKINKDSYRQVLRIMAESLDSWVSKQEIRSKFKGKNTTLDNAINALCTRNIILRKQGIKGSYKLQWMGFALWIKLFAKEES